MYYEFYIGQFFLEQFLSGLLMLLAAGKLSRASPSRLRLVLGSLAGAAGMSVLVCLGWPGLYPVCFCAAAAFTFWRRPLRKEWRGNLSATLCLLAVTVFFGGALEAIIALLPLPLTAAFFAAYAAVSVLSGFLQKKIRAAENTAMVQISLENRNLALEGLLDTGNLLTEPMTGHPVSIAEEQAIAPLLGDGWEERQGFCLIPYHSLSISKHRSENRVLRRTDAGLRKLNAGSAQMRRIRVNTGAAQWQIFCESLRRNLRRSLPGTFFPQRSGLQAFKKIYPPASSAPPDAGQSGGCQSRTLPGKEAPLLPFYQEARLKTRQKNGFFPLPRRK